MGKVLNVGTPEGIGIIIPQPIVTEVIFLFLLGVVAIVLFEFVIYAEARKRGQSITHREAFKRTMSMLKQMVVDFFRLLLLWIITLLPSTVLPQFTALSIASVIESLLGEVRSALPAGLVIATSLLFLLANIAIMHYFFSNYGSIYKLPATLLIRDDIKQLLKARLNTIKSPIEVFLGIVPGAIAYVMTVFNLLVSLVNADSLVPKISLLIVIVLLLTYVVLNEKYEKAVNLVAKVLSLGKKEEKNRTIWMKRKGGKVYIYGRDKDSGTEWVVKVKKEDFEMCVAKKKELGVKDPVRDAMIDYALVHQCVVPKNDAQKS